MGPLKPKTACCGKLICEDGGPPCIEWDRWEKAILCRRCGARYGPLAHADRPIEAAPPHRVRDLKPGMETWVDVRGVLIHEATGKMWVDPRSTTTHLPLKDLGYPGLCSVLVRMNQKGELVAVEGDQGNTTIVLADQSESHSILPLLWQVG